MANSTLALKRPLKWSSKCREWGPVPLVPVSPVSHVCAAGCPPGAPGLGSPIWVTEVSSYPLASPGPPSLPYLGSVASAAPWSQGVGTANTPVFILHCLALSSGRWVLQTNLSSTTGVSELLTQLKALISQVGISREITALSQWPKTLRRPWKSASQQSVPCPGSERRGSWSETELQQQRRGLSPVL